MTLQEFIRNSLLQIADGAHEARRRNENIAIPVSALGKADASCTAIDRRAGFLVEFDVAVTASEKRIKDVSGGIEVASLLKVGGKRSADSEQSSVSRIRFCVPMVFPDDT